MGSVTGMPLVNNRRGGNNNTKDNNVGQHNGREQCRRKWRTTNQINGRSPNKWVVIIPTVKNGTTKCRMNQRRMGINNVVIPQMVARQRQRGSGV